MTAKTLRQFLNGEVISTARFLRADLSPLYNKTEDKVQLGTRMISAFDHGSSMLALLKTKIGYQRRLHLGFELSRFGQITANKSQIVYYELPDIEIIVNDTIFGVQTSKCSKELNYLTLNSYVCSRNVTQSKCTSATPKNCPSQYEAIEDGYVHMNQFTDGKWTYLDIFTNEKVYKLGSLSFPIDNNGHLILRISSLITMPGGRKNGVSSDQYMVYVDIVFPEVINLSYSIYVYLGLVNTSTRFFSTT
jgi:hypothetical protein